MVEVLVDRLTDMACVDEDNQWSWPGSAPIHLNDVLVAKANGVLGSSDPYGDTWKYPVEKERDENYHISRILYFMDHPDKIDGIEVDNPCFDDSILPGCTIIDGWHRLAAAILLELPKINIEYGGRLDIEDYISGKTDVRPEEMLFIDIPIY